MFLSTNLPCMTLYPIKTGAFYIHTESDLDQALMPNVFSVKLLCAMMPATPSTSDKRCAPFLSKTWKGAQCHQATFQQHWTVSCHHYSTCYEWHPNCPKVNSTQLISKNQKTKAIAHMGKKNKQDLVLWVSQIYLHKHCPLLFKLHCERKTERQSNR